MKNGSRKLTLQRETLVALTPDALEAVAGGNADGGNRSVSLPPSRVCPPSRTVTFCTDTISIGNKQGGGQ